VAAAFLDWNYSDKAATDMLSLGTIYPTNNCDLNSVKGIDPKIIGLDKMILDAQNTGKIGYCSWTYWPANVDTYSWNNLDALYLGQITLDEYIKNLESNYKLDVQKGNGFKF
jgi:raffinose/stachyose/melibiose transport system substrate-binding protein